jgi:hypothetical protein
MTSTRSSDYATTGSGGNGISSGSQLSRRLARGLLPGDKEEEDNNSTPVAFDVDDGISGKVELDGECEGDGNSDGPVDNNNNNNYDINDDNNNGNHDEVGGQDRSANMGRLWRSGKRWR